MSITVERPTSSIARAEYSAGEFANNRNRPRLSIGAARTPTPVPAAYRSRSRRDNLLPGCVIKSPTLRIRSSLQVDLPVRAALGSLCQTDLWSISHLAQPPPDFVGSRG